MCSSKSSRPCRPDTPSCTDDGSRSTFQAGALSRVQRRDVAQLHEDTEVCVAYRGCSPPTVRTLRPPGSAGTQWFSLFICASVMRSGQLRVLHSTMLTSVHTTIFRGPSPLSDLFSPASVKIGVFPDARFKTASTARVRACGWWCLCRRSCGRAERRGAREARARRPDGLAV
jgi:hypothetical protein